jgi:hypothetical protein
MVSLARVSFSRLVNPCPSSSKTRFRLETASPWVLDDVLALVLADPVEQQLRDQFDPLFPGPVRRESRAAVCTRSSCWAQSEEDTSIPLPQILGDAIAVTSAAMSSAAGQGR